MTPGRSTNAHSTNDIAFGRLGFGAANIGNLYRVISDEQAWSVLDAAWDAGIRYFDTAPHYGLGLSERRLGAFLATKPRDEFTLLTKVRRLLRPNPAGFGTLDTAHDFAVPGDVKQVWDFSAEGIHASIEESLQRMGLESIDIAYLHDPEKYDLNAGIESGIPALSALRDAGLVHAIGVGSMSVPALLRSVRTGNARPAQNVERMNQTIPDEVFTRLKSEGLIPA